MGTPSWMEAPPKRILLATDLSPRCDRALARAARLAEQWRSDLVVLHVLEGLDRRPPETGLTPSWRKQSDPRGIARKQLCADIGDVGGRATMLIAEGDPAEEILRAGDAERCEMIVIGLGREGTFGRFGLGKTMDRLLRRSRLPVLVVRERPRGPYRHILAATDFSASSRHAIELAARLFPEQTLTVFHAYSAPMSGLMTNAASYRREYRRVALRECDAFLATVARPETGWRELHVLVEDGAPGPLLRDYAVDMDVDLVVLGASGRSAFVEAFVGCAAKSIIHEVPCDALLVGEPRTQAD